MKIRILAPFLFLILGCSNPEVDTTITIPSDQPKPPEQTTVSKIDTLQKAVAYAEKIRDNVDQITDYTCTLTKRERIAGRLLNYEQSEIKVRHNPFSVYMKYNYPSDIFGREILYIGGDSMMVKRGGKRLQNATVNVGINSPLAQENSRYPITNLGFKHALNELIRIGHKELKFPQNEIQVIEANVKI